LEVAPQELFPVEAQSFLAGFGKVSRNFDAQ
jgi:hypothetical protein